MKCARFLILVSCFHCALANIQWRGDASDSANHCYAAERDWSELTLTLPVPTPEQRRAENHDRVVAARFSPSARFLALGTRSGSLVVLDMAKKGFVFAHEGHTRPLKLIDFAADDRHLITGADDLQVRFWSVDEGKPSLSFQGAPLRSLYDIALSPRARYALSRGFDGFGVLWDLKANKKVQDLFSYAFAFDPTGSYFVTAPRRRPGAQLVRLGQEENALLIARDQLVGCTAIDSTGRIVAYAVQSWEGPSKVVLADARSGREMRNLSVPRDEDEQDAGVTALGFSPDGKRILVGCTDGRVHCADSKTMAIRHTYRVPAAIMVSDVRFASDQYVIVAGLDESAETETRCWRQGGQKAIWRMKGAVTIDAGRMLGALPTTAGDLALFDATSGNRLLALRGYLRGTKWLANDRTGEY